MPAPPAAAAAALDIAANASALDALYPCSDGKPMAESVSEAVRATTGLEVLPRRGSAAFERP